MKANPSSPYTVAYRAHDTLSQDQRYIEALTPIFEAAEAIVLARRKENQTKKLTKTKQERLTKFKEFTALNKKIK